MENKSEKATFGMGCFWHSEEAFRRAGPESSEPRKGIISTTVGYMGGHVDNPTYEQVCGHTTGHAEVVQVAYNPDIISFEELLDIFWENHDPTQVNRQGPDIGENYRSVIFYHSEEQRIAAEKSKNERTESGRKIVTVLEPVKTFWQAEEYHQKYLAKHGLSTCPI